MSIFNSLRDRLSKTRNNLVNRIKETISGKASIDSNTLEQIEEILISSDVGYYLSNKIIENVRTKMLNTKDRTSDKIIFDVVKSELKKIFDNNSTSRVSESNNQAKPYIILVIGVNGAGKTTTIGKLAYNYKEQGKKVLIAASDTFRAAASEQLEIWSERAKADIVISEKSVDPSAVAYEAIEKAHKEKYDVLLIDTAGRLHTKSYLMDELVKLNRIITKKLNRAPDETLLVLDGNSGQNAVVQSDEFSKTALITGLVITKLDGTAKGGIVFQIFEKQKIPVKYIGVGEDITDLQPFNAEEFISAIVDIN
ncbi:MAG: signal recognition particle-docking protein FtsY [Ignavibacteria bacterium RIFOXYB2_FULL_35_12]|nr:MAG: signal recognition particle-docking protein FtsY [Ignavibacteria bacterium GWA2_36_19]OGU50259.1 MAG: signal recognition particle-docking protein FtsY [Ignavibacteria bacterium GWC2_35_8]OGU57977.1 MAG: signal recognition particle-docking protein FtsY [Ignavibacteria bacterium GWF2_35_20]OGU79523.1 MAG: signal recognition particle-docking protein FtsY [Ignavibacteria bacterium RIFOXYA2_FULL_35_9]OGU90506.1 MAG: signal recognition particle-docking protein FtsY [Ignavibacteria bacterium R